MPSLSSLAFLLALACVSCLGLAKQQDPAKLPTSLVPAPRTDDGSIKRETECIKRATESAPANVLFVGDSITQSWEGPGRDVWAKHFAPLGALNLGNSGDRTENVLWRLDKAPLTRLQPKHIVLLIGTNNLGHGTSNAQETLDGVKAVAAKIGEQCPTAKVHIVEIFPRGERFNNMRGDICQINQALRAWVAAQKGSSFAIHAIGDRFMSADGSISKEIMPDFLHLTPKGYEMWAEALVPVLK